MLPGRRIVWSVVLFTIIFGLLSVRWPGLQEAYSKAFQRVGTRVFGRFGEKGIVKFLPAQRVSRISDTEITTKVEGSPYVGVGEISPRLMGYLPMAELLALVLVSTVAWRRRLVAILGGMLLLHATLYLRLWILIRIYFSADETPWQQYHPSPTTLNFLNRTNEIINTAPTAGFVIPVLIWLAVTFRYSDWERALGRRFDSTGNPVNRL